MTAGVRERIVAMKERIGATQSLADAEVLWPMALKIDAALPCPQNCRATSHELLWAVSHAIKAARLEGGVDIRRVSDALDAMEKAVDA